MKQLTKERKQGILREVAKRFPLSAEDQQHLEDDILFVEIDRKPYKVRLRKDGMKPHVRPKQDTYYVYRYIFPSGVDWNYELVGIIHPEKSEIEVDE